MNGSAPEAPDASPFFLPRTYSWPDDDSGHTIVLSQPEREPELWRQYVTGALRSYRKYGVQDALDFDQMCDGHDTTIFYSAVDNYGQVVGGVRMKGPLRSANDAHAVVEWAGHPAQRAVRKMIADRLSLGIVETRTAWVVDTDHPHRLARTLARTALPTLALLGVRFMLATAGAHVLDRWRSSGGVVAEDIPAAFYPNEQHRTKMLWWDRQTLAAVSEASQLNKSRQEMRILAAQSAQFHSSCSNGVACDL
ncbi:hypothetical protein MB901379_01286 [Mycobacterium basiliense]|uniref:N-acetyltransferase domain-containing protein n=1 Tax=Mycobacterium basiliense TaxID=2094119 RepID=A0A3S5CZL6_9MYCO|nr:hypothetical protein [Mycobacterium basiliense]VDM87741.1 hypothetical protein MB901379_01286 [Mycobacterium basiliense]